jgi:type IV fimbrial biogenesis protein FimT
MNLFKTNKLHTTYGFTLMELIIVLAISSILMTSAIPAFSQMLARNKQTAKIHLLFAHHRLARSEAIISNQRVTLCKSSDSLQCTRNSQWHDGWIVFIDANHDKRVSSSERIIFVQQALENNMTLKYRGFGSHNYISYFPGGRTTSNGTFTLCNQFGEKTAKGLIISRTGRAHLSDRASNGNPLECI